MQTVTTDIAVAGGGFAGVAAALAAARQGARVILMEQSGCLGGAASNNLVNPFMRYWTEKDGKKVRVCKKCGAQFEYGRDITTWQQD